jgi:hypothetical protein
MMLYSDINKKHKNMVNKSIVDAVVTMLRMYDVDGETMEHIINEVGMRDQMVKQLSSQDDIVDDEDDQDGEPIMVSFTTQHLIEYTREIQERCKSTAIDAVKKARIDFDDMIELELRYDKQISVDFDERSLYLEIESVIDDTFETDDEAVLSEITNVLEYIIQK